MNARMKAIMERRQALVAQCALDRAALADASSALVAPLAVADLTARAMHAVREPPARVVWGARILRLLSLRRAASALRFGWGAYVVLTTAARALRVVRRAERALP